MLHGLAREGQLKTLLPWKPCAVGSVGGGGSLPECVPMSLAKEEPSVALSSSAFFTSILGHSVAPGTRELMALRKTKCPLGPQIQSDQKLWQGPSTEHPPRRLGTPPCVHPVDGAPNWGSGAWTLSESGAKSLNLSAPLPLLLSRRDQHGRGLLADGSLYRGTKAGAPGPQGPADPSSPLLLPGDTCDHRSRPLAIQAAFRM